MNHTETLAQERIRTSALQRIIGSPATPALLVLLIALSMASIKLAFSDATRATPQIVSDAIAWAQAEPPFPADVDEREEFEVVKEMAEKARTENDSLAQRIAALESRLGKTESN